MAVPPAFPGLVASSDNASPASRDVPVLNLMRRWRGGRQGFAQIFDATR